ncbi:MAG: hypothetical protein P5672_25755, partial [Limnospira sp. PMC 1234.20]|uniref:hypothetical protein n=1 Tax=Limnospira sp. PMC 1234.20 TaxID=2981032 RepID=UPI0028E0FAF1
LEVKSRRTGDLIALSAGGAGASGASGVALAGSVSIALIFNDTEARLQDGSVQAGGALTVMAYDRSMIVSVAGAAAFGGKVGLGSAVAVNNIASNTRARLRGTTLPLSVNHGGALTVHADNSSSIYAVAGSVGASKSVGGAGTVSINTTINRTEAVLENVERPGTGLSGGNISVLGDDGATIWSFSGGVGGGATVGFGAAVAFNLLNNDTEA